MNRTSQYIGNEQRDKDWGQMPTRSQFTYEEFVWKWEDIYKMHVKPHIRAAMEYRDKDKSAYNMAFEPT